MFFMRLFFLRTSTPQPVEHGDQLVAGHRGLPAGRSVLIAGNESLLQGPGHGGSPLLGELSAAPQAGSGSRRPSCYRYSPARR